ncbi:MAG: hypothetical protein ACHQ7M_08795 [Chloroflexota bacterium]
MGVLKKNLKSDDDQAMSATYDYYVGEVIPKLPYPKADQLGDAEDELSVGNDAVRRVDLSKLLDDSFVKSAAQRGLDK